MHLPGPVRATVGLLATVADEARNLPDRALELPMLAVSTALQASLRAQQRYARLTARGDEALARRRTGDDPPDWATFDDPVPSDQLRADLSRPVERIDRPHPAVKQAAAAKKTAAAKKSAAIKKSATARRAAAKRTAAAKASPAAGPTPPLTPAAPAPAAPSAPADETAPPGALGKAVSSPRHTAPSRFDTVDMAADVDADPDRSDPTDPSD